MWGVQYQDVLDRHGILPSMSRAYCSQDNAHMESFFLSMAASPLNISTNRLKSVTRPLSSGSTLMKFCETWFTMTRQGFVSYGIMAWCIVYFDLEGPVRKYGDISRVL